MFTFPKSRRYTRPISCFILTVSLFITGNASAQSTLDGVRDRGYVRCGIRNQSAPGLAVLEEGNVRGFEADFCRVIAAATLGDKNAVEFIYVSVRSRFDTLSRGEMDVLINSVTWNSGRDSQFSFGPIILYDEQGFLARSSINIETASDLDGQRVCVVGGTTTADNLVLLQQTANINFSIIETENPTDSQTRYTRNECNIWTNDRTQLMSYRSNLANPDAHRFLDLGITFSKEPLAVITQAGDAGWSDIVRWSIYATILAEEAGVTSGNVKDQRVNSTDAGVRRLLGVPGSGATPELLGLSNDAFYNAIEQVGNYSEIYERHLGEVGFPRGLNSLYTNGGLLYAPPMR